MDGVDFFRKLTAGAKFNFKRFQKDAERLEIVKAQKPSRDLTLPGVTQTAQKRPLEQHHIEETTKKIKSNEDAFEGEAVSVEGTDSDADPGDDLQLLGAITAPACAPQQISHTTKKHKKQQPKSEAKLAELKVEELRHFRNQHHIHAHGSDMPDPVTRFELLGTAYGVSQQLLSNVGKMGFSVPTSIQMQAIPAMMERREILGCAPTGSGKTLSFLLPVLHHLKGPMKKGFRALILAPTRELAKQIHRECVRLAEGTGLRIVFIEKSGTAVEKYGPKTAQKFDVLVTTPNRLVYLIRDDPPLINLANVEWLVVDESDKLFEDGMSGFRQQLAAIYQACCSPRVCRALFSATFAYEVEQWCKLNLNNVMQVYIGARNSAIETIDQRLEYVGTESGKLLALRNLITQGIQPPVLIFVQSKDRAKELFHEIIYERINVDVIHSDRTQAQRDKVVDGFRDGRIWILICTDLMGRGIDFKGVNLVINYDFPNSAISYIHKIGRTGRAGRRGQSVTYFTDDDKMNLRSIANVLRGAGCPVPEYMTTLYPATKDEKKKLARSAPFRKSVRTLPKERQKKKQWKQHTTDRKVGYQSTEGKAYDAPINKHKPEQHRNSHKSHSHSNLHKAKRKTGNAKNAKGKTGNAKNKTTSSKDGNSSKAKQLGNQNKKKSKLKSKKNKAD